MSKSSEKKAAIKQNTKVLKAKRYHRRQWLTVGRIFHYGLNNFTRNAWLTIAATAVMAVTLVSIFITVAAQDVLQRTVKGVVDRTEMTIYLEPNTERSDVADVITRIKALPSVNSVTFTSTDQARSNFTDENKTDDNTIQALIVADNVFPASIAVGVKDLNDTADLDHLVKTDSTLAAHINTQFPPTNLDKSKSVIGKLGRWVSTAQRVGWVASVIFVALSVLVIFNTIRMAIFSRKEEIQMMKLIGASRHFIRGPFIVESVVYGFVGAIVATGASYALLMLAKDKIGEIDVGTTLRLVTDNIVLVILMMVVVGAIIGVISSILATRRYLKI